MPNSTEIITNATETISNITEGTEEILASTISQHTNGTHVVECLHQIVYNGTAIVEKVASCSATLIDKTIPGAGSNTFTVAQDSMSQTMEYFLTTLAIVAIMMIFVGMMTAATGGFSGRKKRKTCSVCEKKTRSYYNNKGIIYCKDCAKMQFKICTSCDHICNKLTKFKDHKLCNYCLKNNIKKCHKCHKQFFKGDCVEYYGHLYCETCNKSNRYFKKFNPRFRKIYSKVFNTNPYKDFVGIEIECLNRHRDKASFTPEEGKKYGFGAGTDGSLSGMGQGTEFRSLPFQGDDLLNRIAAFGKELVRREYYTNTSCGLHIHLEVPNNNLSFLKKIYIFYSRFEKFFFNMLPKSRQDTGYCDKFDRYDDYTEKEVIPIRKLHDFKTLFYNSSLYLSKQKYHGHDKRYCWINLHSIFYRGTLEVRAHSGTINSKKINNWIMIHLTILNTLKKMSLQELLDMPVTRPAFLKLFKPKLRTYIQRRWDKFPQADKESDLK